jgi:hypothetical protein
MDEAKEATGTGFTCDSEITRPIVALRAVASIAEMSVNEMPAKLSNFEITDFGSSIVADI